MASRQAGERWPCEACGEVLIGALTVNLKVAPVEAVIAEDGNVWLGRRADGTIICATLAGALLDKAREVGITLHHNHFATCVDKERFR